MRCKIAIMLLLLVHSIPLWLLVFASIMVAPCYMNLFWKFFYYLKIFQDSFKKHQMDYFVYSSTYLTSYVKLYLLIKSFSSQFYLTILSIQNRHSWITRENCNLIYFCLVMKEKNVCVFEILRHIEKYRPNLGWINTIMRQ